MERPKLVVVGGIGDKESVLQKNVQVLSQQGFNAKYYIVDWFNKGLQANVEVARLQAFLNDFQPEVAYGRSAGGLLLVNAGYGLPYLNRIITAAAPIRAPRPDEMTIKIKTFMRICPLLGELKKYYYKNIIDEVKNKRDTGQQFLHFRGTRDTRTHNLSTMDGSDDSMLNIRHEELKTPRFWRRGLTIAHSWNIENVIFDERFKRFAKGEWDLMAR